MDAASLPSELLTSLTEAHALALVGSAVALVALVCVLLLVRVLRLRRQSATSPSNETDSKVALVAPRSATDVLEVVIDEHAADVLRSAPLDVTTLVPERPIGSGGQGGVWLAYDPTSGKKCALKQLRKGRLAALKKVSSVKPEACQWLVEREALLKCGAHPFITTCLATFQDPESLFFALELASGGDLFSLLHASPSGSLPEAQCRFYSSCVALALKHIHAAGFLYCDIKLENVLITSTGYVKLCDFGLAKKLLPVKRGRCPSLLGLSARDGDARSMSKCGTDQYAPPEVVAGQGRSKGADWWALGVLLHEMLTGHSPFEGAGMAAIYARVEEYANGGKEAAAQLRAEAVEDSEDLSSAGGDFLIGLLTPDESRRLGCGSGGFAASVQVHPWFASLDWVALLRQQLPAPWVPASAEATDKRGSQAPTADEIRDDVASLFDPKRGVLRERPFDPETWRHLFEPFGPSLPERLIKPPPGIAASQPSSTANDSAAAHTSAAVPSAAAPAAAPNKQDKAPVQPRAQLAIDGGVRGRANSCDSCTRTDATGSMTSSTRTSADRSADDVPGTTKERTVSHLDV